MYKEFKTLHYVSVSKSVVDQVHVTIKTENGSVVSFVTGKTILKLENQSRTNGHINSHLTIAQVMPRYNHNNEKQEALL